MSMLKGFTIIMTFLFIGEITSKVLNMTIPGNIIGLVLLLICLIKGYIPLKTVEKAGSALLAVLALLFVPVGVGIIEYLDLIKQQFFPLVAASMLSTLIVLIITSKTADILFELKTQKRGKGLNE